MKKQMTAVLVAACVGLVNVPVSAEPVPPFKHFRKDRDYSAHGRRHYYPRSRHHYKRHHRDDDDNAGAAVAGAIFGAITGAIISDLNRNRAAPPPRYGGYCNYDACS